VGVWVGNADNTEIPGVTGAQGAAPIWRDTLYNSLMLDNTPALDFSAPAGYIVQGEVCAETGAQAWEACVGYTRNELFHAEHLPPTSDQDFLKIVPVDRATGLIANQWCDDDIERRRYLQLDDATAIQWINDTADGRAWAEAHSIAVPLQQMPTQECSEQTIPTHVVIASPYEGEVVSGILEVRGYVSMPRFSRYQLEAAPAGTPDAWGIVDGYFETMSSSETVLAHWDTQAVVNGPYNLRIIAFDEIGRTAEYQVFVNVHNVVITPTDMPTATLPPTITETPTPTSTFIPTTEPTAIPPMPTSEASDWTPTWTPTATVTPEGG
jgi:membrane carboxypeptidase/penicillin-binding protein PbpC